MKTSEWALIFFTILSQAAAGLMIVVATGKIMCYKDPSINIKMINDKVMLLICALMLAAMALSLLHLGNLKNAVYTVSNFSTSWLSREIFFVLLFCAAVILCAFVDIKELFSLRTRGALEISVSVIGLALVFAMAKVYMLQNVPSWNSAFTPVLFYLTSLLLGVVTYLAAVLLLSDGMAGPRFIRIILGIAVFLLFAEMIIWLLHTAMLFKGERAALESFCLITKDNAILFYGRIIIQAVLLFLTGYLSFSAGKGAVHVQYVYIMYILMIISEFIGRYLFYAMYAGSGV